MSISMPAEQFNIGLNIHFNQESGLTIFLNISLPRRTIQYIGLNIHFKQESALTIFMNISLPAEQFNISLNKNV